MKIATLTLNPALDRTMYFGGDVGLGMLNRAAAPSVTTIGGKGTNVSCVFKIFGVESTAYGFIGGDNGDLFLKLLEPYALNTDFTRTKCETRLNVKIISGDGEPTEFNESGGPIDIKEKEDLLGKIKNIIDDTDLFFMGGSVPPGIDKSIYSDIINLGGDKTKFIVDCDGEALKLCMANKKKPYIIKPNLFELEQYCGKKFDFVGTPYMASDGGHDISCPYNTAIDEIKSELQKIYGETGVIVLCTLGEHGGLYCGPEGVYYQNAPKVEVRGFAGAGDAFLPAFVAGYYGLGNIPCRLRTAPPFAKGGRGLDAERALLFAVATASAKVAKPGSEPPSLDEVMEMYGRIVG